MNNEKEHIHMMFVDRDGSPDPCFIDITAEQKRLFDWLRDNGFLNEDCEIYNLSDDSSYEKI